MAGRVDPTWEVTVSQGRQSQAVTVETLREVVQVMTESGPVAEDATCVVLDSPSAAIAATIPEPRAARRLTIVQADSGTEGHTVVLEAGTWDGSNDTATLDAQGEGIEVVGTSDTRFVVLANRGGVSFS